MSGCFEERKEDSLICDSRNIYIYLFDNFDGYSQKNWHAAFTVCFFGISTILKARNRKSSIESWLLEEASLTASRFPFGKRKRAQGRQGSGLKTMDAVFLPARIRWRETSTAGRNVPSHSARL